MNETRLHAWWYHRQGLDGSLDGASPATVLERCGWARSVGGVAPYMTLFARAGTPRETADAAAAALEIHELPAARNCTYVVPRSDFALALAVGQPFAGSELDVAAKLGVTSNEIERLCSAVLAGLAGGTPLEPDALRAATGSASRSLGEAGRKKGVSTTLPVALGLLQTRGEIRRVPTSGRLDQQRYRYARWSQQPLDSAAEPFIELARHFFRWVGPATRAEFQWFSGLGVKATKEALAPLDLVPAEDGAERLLLPDDSAAFRAFERPAEPSYALVSSLDPISANRRDVQSLLAPEHRDHPLLASASSLADLPHHAILDRGRILGFWEYDPDAAAIVWATFARVRDPALAAAIEHTQTFVHDQLGDARAYSLDSVKRRRPRIEALRTMGAARTAL
jgi:hypothetical protein